MEEFECKSCSKKFKTEESLNQHINASHKSEEKKTDKKKIKKYFVMIGIILAIIVFGYTFYIRGQAPGEYDNFAKCLNEKGAVMYGNDFCQYTAKQLNMFGKSGKYLNYVKCADNEKLCNLKSIDITPTWEINGKMYEQVQNFDTLGNLAGCEI